MSTTTKKDRKGEGGEEATTTVPTPSQLQKEQQEAVNKALDETKDDIKTATKEARKEIPQYTQRLGDLQEQTIQTTIEIADNYIESQKEIINVFQSIWTPFTENIYSRFWNYWWISPKGIAETYGRIASSFADNIITATRLTNNSISANMEVFSTAMQQTKDNSKEFSKIGVSAAKAFHEASNNIATTGFFAAETATRQQR
jgi:hypothetical protein